MSDLSKAEFIEKFRKYVDREPFEEDIRVVVRIAGGMPSEYSEEELTLLGTRKLNVRTQDMLSTGRPQEASAELEQNEMRDLLQQMGAGLDSLVTRSEARFLPDSLIGTITIEFGGEKETFYFLADKAERRAQNKSLAPEVNQAINRLSTISRRLFRLEEVHDE